MLTQIMHRFRGQKEDEESRFAKLCLEGKGAESNGPWRKSCCAFLARLPKHPPSLFPTQLGLLENRPVVTSESDDVWPDGCQIRAGASCHSQDPNHFISREARIKKNHQALKPQSRCGGDERVLGIWAF